MCCLNQFALINMYVWCVWFNMLYGSLHLQFEMIFTNGKPSKFAFITGCILLLFPRGTLLFNFMFFMNVIHIFYHGILTEQYLYSSKPTASVALHKLPARWRPEFKSPLLSVHRGYTHMHVSYDSDNAFS